MSDDLRKQVALQCKAVAHLATALAQVNLDCAKMFEDGAAESLIQPVGKRTAHLMEVLGDILNGLDATDEADAWLAPIFEEAQRLWPA